MKNIENCKLVLDTIEKDPSNWDQDDWHCGSKHCFAGWAQILANLPPHVFSVRRDARIFLGLTYHEANYYFAPMRTLEELKTILEDFYDTLGFGRDGYDRNGYDRSGYNQIGYNLNGYDRSGYNRNGYDRNGYDRDGYNQFGYNKHGYNRNGYDRRGYDRDGLNINNIPK